MNVRTWLKTAKTKILALDAELILCHVLGNKDRSYLAAHGEDEMSPSQRVAANWVVWRRRRGVPLAYIVGQREFYGREFLVDRHTLVPRPESEAVVRLALAEKPRKVLDIGTGSGCLAISIAAEADVEVVGADKSSRALAMARKNAERLGVGEKVTLMKSDLLNKVESLNNFDLVVANLPYVDKKWEWLDKKTLRHEPKSALYANEHGLYLIKKLIREMKKRRMKCALILEADQCQHAEIIEFARGFGFEFEKKDGFAVLLRRE